MARHDLDRRLLVRIIRDPGAMAALDPLQLGRLLDAAVHARLRGWLLTRLEAAAAPMEGPSWLVDRIADARAHAADAEREISWEIDRIGRAFLASDIKWVLLKGAGYVAAGLPPGRGRQVGDLDVLVPEAEMRAAEAILRDHGWEPVTLHPYDEQYYRVWAQELPPMIHVERGSVIDLHHAILPRTSRLRPSSARLLERATSVNGLRVLCPAHMVLHAAAHLFHDGDVAGAIRDLVDIDGLLRAFAAEPGFWEDLLAEAERLDLERPAFYALRYSRRLAGTPVPPSIEAAMRSWAPPRPVLAAMDALVERTISGRPGPTASMPALALYIRAFWLRMPPLLLARHLTHKALRRWVPRPIEG